MHVHKQNGVNPERLPQFGQISDSLVFVGDTTSALEASTRATPIFILKGKFYL